MSTVRPATEADRDRLVALDSVAWDTRSTPAELPLEGDWAGEVPLEQLTVAERDGEVVGYALIAPHNPLPSSRHLGLVRSLAVHPEARGEGLGRRVMAAALDRAREQGFDAVVLNVLETNRGARALYTAIGFREVGRVPDHFRIGGESVADLLLRIDLTDPRPSEWLDGGCHCGAVRFRVHVRRWEVLDCNCSMCAKKAILHLIADEADVELLTGEQALATYRFGTGTAAHHFCRTCGIHPFYRPRSHPEGWSVNARCLDGEVLDRFVVRPFDGRNWEANIDGIR